MFRSSIVATIVSAVDSTRSTPPLDGVCLDCHLQFRGNSDGMGPAPVHWHSESGNDFLSRGSLGKRIFGGTRVDFTIALEKPKRVRNEWHLIDASLRESDIYGLVSCG